MTRLAVQAGSGDETRAVVSAGWQHDEVAGERLVLPDQHHIPHLKTQKHGHQTIQHVLRV